MKKLKLLVFSFLLIGLISFNGSDVKAAEPNYIEEFNITLDVNENGSIDVSQKISVNFLNESHGIFVTLPQTYTMTWDEETTREYFFPVKNVQVKDHMYEVESSSEGLIIIIGDPEIYVNGLVNYEYTYTIQTKDLDYNDLQMIYFDIVGEDWQMRIDQTNFTINMPKDFSQKPEFYPPTSEDLKYLEFSVDGRTIKGSYYKSLGDNEALTMLLRLDNNYFIFPDNSTSATIFTGLFGVFTIIVIGLFFKFGKDDPVIKTVEFNPPNNMSSAEVGYVIDGSIENKDIISLIVYWASRGYLNIKDLGKEDFEFIKVKDIDESELGFEKSLFNELFKNEDTVQKDSIPDGFKELVMQKSSSDYEDRYSGEKALYVSFASKLKYILFAILSLTNTLMVAYFINFEYGIFFYVLAAGGITFVLSFILGIVINRTITNMQARTKTSNLGRIIGLIIYSLLFIFVYLIILIIANVSGLVILISIVLTFVNYIFIAFMSKRTTQGNIWLGQILGFKDFIIYAEKDRLEMLVEEDPKYFYNILPYAYVLGVSSKWIKQFEDISLEKPDWYITNRPVTDLLYLSYLNTTLNNVSSQINQIDIKDIGSSGGFSGGISGGGFSGGGFGGGGGGSW